MTHLVNLSGKLTFAVALLSPLLSCASPALSVISTNGTPGSTVLVAVNYTTDTNTPSLQFYLLYNTNDLASGTPVGGDALVDHQLGSSEIQPGARLVLIFSISNTSLTNGVLAYVPLAIATNAPDHDESLMLSNVIVNTVEAPVAAGVSNGILAIVVPPAFSSILQTNGGSIHVQLSGGSNRNYVISAATNLESPQWIVLSTNLATNGVVDWEDTLPADPTTRFYRAMLLQ